MRKQYRIAGIICLALMSVSAACQQPGPPRDEPPLSGEALKQRQHEIAVEARDIVQQIRDSMAAAAPCHDSSIYSSNMVKSDSADPVRRQGKDKYGAYSYIAPLEFPGLTGNVAGWLANRGYLIPQIYPPMLFKTAPDLEHVNAVTGEFIQAGQVDWAIYCCIDTNASILIFEGQDTLEIHLLAHLPDSTKIGCCNHAIYQAKKKDILSEPDYQERFATALVVDHDGLYFGDANYPLELLYFSSDKWIQMTPFYD